MKVYVCVHAVIEYSSSFIIIIIVIIVMSLLKLLTNQTCYSIKTRRAVGCYYFLPGLRLPSQPKSVSAHWPVPHYTAWWQTCEPVAVCNANENTDRSSERRQMVAAEGYVGRAAGCGVFYWKVGRRSPPGGASCWPKSSW